MPQRNLEDDLNEAFRKFQQEARERARAEGKKEVTQEDYNQNPVVKLTSLYQSWNDYSFERYDSLKTRLQGIELTVDDALRFHFINKNDGLDYHIFMCAVGEVLKSKGHTKIDETELKPFVESEFLRPQLFYLAEHTQEAKVRFEELDTVVLMDCKWASLSDFDAGNLTVDCDFQSYGGIGSRMKSGKIVVTQKVRPKDLGWEMKGGTIIYEGDYNGGSIGERIGGDSRIIINGNVTGEASIGYEMKGGDITIKGNCHNSEICNYGVGYEMSGGRIKIEGNYGNNRYLGCYMDGGVIEVAGNVQGKVSVGTRNKNGSRIIVNGNCLGHEIGGLMEGGLIKIVGDVGVDIASNMSGGEIKIGGNVHQQDEQYVYPVGSRMTGGTIRIGGDVKEISSEMFGGTIHIDGNFIYKDALLKFMGYNGKVYEKGKLVEPLSGWGIVAKIIKGD